MAWSEQAKLGTGSERKLKKERTEVATMEKGQHNRADNDAKRS